MTLPVSDSMITKYLAVTVRGEEVPLRPLGYSFKGQSIVRVLDQLAPTETWILQTDKPVYKPGQTGMM